MNYRNLLLNTDSYKASHWLQYPPGTENVSSYVEARGSQRYTMTVPFGLQYTIKEYLMTPITQADINEAAEFWAAHGEPFNKEGWQYILDKYQGKLPVRIKAVPEGLVLPLSLPLMTIEATDEKCFWLVSYLETLLLRGIWYGTTVATQSYYIKEIIKAALEKTGDVGGLPFKLHDFGARGVSSFESAGIGGAAHLINFMGTDTVSGILFAKKYYNESGMPAFSIPAAEHSTITSWGQTQEFQAYRNMIKQYAGVNKDGTPKLYAVVSDSYDIYNAVSNGWGKELKDEVIKAGGILVVRPDSGHPAAVVTNVIRRLDEAYGSVVNAKGYKVLNNVRVIQGDGINPDSIKEIIAWVSSAGYSIDNVAFGMGGQLLQGVNRDTISFAMKASAIKINGKWQEVFKNPVGDDLKKSKRGRQSLQFGQGIYYAAPISPDGYEWQDGYNQSILELVYENGELVRDQTFQQIRDLAAKGIRTE